MMRQITQENSVSGDHDPADVESLKAEILKSIARALESRADSGEPGVDVRSGVDFYEEVTRFETELIKQALACTGGNQRAAARLLRLKTSTLNSKVKQYHLDFGPTSNEADG